MGDNAKFNGSFRLTLKWTLFTRHLPSAGFLYPHPPRWVHCNYFSQHSHACVPLLNLQKMYKETKIYIKKKKR